MSKPILIGIFALSLCALFCAVQGSVLGIDLGNEFMKISSISPGRAFMIVENTATRRKTQSAIAFLNNERWFEADALQKKSRAFPYTFIYLQKYLGKSYNESVIETNKERYFDHYKFQKQEEKGSFQFVVDTFKVNETESAVFSTEEIVAMYLKHAKNLADKQTNMNIKDVVLTVPPYFGIPERVALAEAVQLASLKPLAFIHENTAAALYYAIERKDENKTHTVLFYNLGSTSLKVTIAEFTMENSTERGDEPGKKYESFRVLADAWDDEVGGYIFDLNLAKWLADEYDNQPGRQGKAKSRDSLPAMAKLIKEANRAKETLSANKDTSVYIEALMDDKDLKATVQRSQFEEVNKAQFELLTAPIQAALNAANKTLADIDAIELLGGALRVPKVQQILQDFVGKDVEIGSHMNGDEAMALGTSFYAASMSASFRTRPVYMNDGLNFAIYMLIRGYKADDSFEKSGVLFETKEKLGKQKAFAFEYDKDLEIILYTTDSEGKHHIFSSFLVNNTINEFAEKRTENMTEPKIGLVFRLNLLGLVDLIKSEVFMEETVLVEVPAPKKKAKAKKAEKPASTDSNSTDEALDVVDDADAAATADEPEPAKQYKEKIVPHNKDLPHFRHTPSHLKFSDQTLKKMWEGLNSIEEQEELKKKRAEAKNRLESFVYQAQELAGDEEFQTYAKEEELEALKRLALENDDWLYSDEGKNAVLADFEDRYYNITDIAQKIIFRQTQWQTRDKVIADAYKVIEDFEPKVSNLNITKPWIKDEDKQDVLKKADDVKTWLDATVVQLQAQGKTEDPIASTKDIEKKMKKLIDAFFKVSNTPKPKEGKSSNPFGGVSEDILFDLFLKQKNITISGVDEGTKNMFKSSMRAEFDTWKENFMKKFEESLKDKNNTNSSENNSGDQKSDEKTDQDAKSEQDAKEGGDSEQSSNEEDNKQAPEDQEL